MDSRQDLGLSGENKIVHIPEQQKKDGEKSVPSIENVESIHSIASGTGILGDVVSEELSKVHPTSKEDLLLPGGTHDLENTHLIQNAISSVEKDKEFEESMQLIEETIHLLPHDLQCVPPGFTEIPLPVIEKSVQLGTDNLVPLKEVVDGKMLFHTVLNELDRLKERLGGAPNFGDNAHPSLDDPDSHKTFCRIPMPAVKDWLRMVLYNKWMPQPFWKAIASLFRVTTNTLYSQYEEAHIRIQRFGMLIANKERIIDILKNKEEGRFFEFSEIVGLAWHPKANDLSTEILYIDFIEKFLKEDFQAAKERGDDALVDYFNAFQGVCFEERCRNLEQFAIENPTKADEDIKNLNEVLEDILDIDFNKPVATAFDVLASVVVKKEGDVSPTSLLEEVRQQGIFDKEFFVKDSGQIKPTLEDFQDYCLERIEQCAMAPYSSVEEFLEIELEVLKNSGKEINKENFIERLVKAEEKEIFGDEQDSFSCDAPAVGQFIQNNFSS